MNFFINQGRCRVCGKYHCCFNHQKEHERQEHKEYVYLLDKLPIMCQKCCRRINSVYDLHAKCHPFMDPHLMNGNFNKVTVLLLNKPNRKRTMIQERELNDDAKAIISAASERKILRPVYRFKRTDIRKVITTAEISQQTLIIEVNQIGLLVDTSKSSVFSPQLNVSYKMLMNNSIIKSSTPLNEDNKENSPVVPQENIEKDEDLCKSPDFSVYKTPQVLQSPMIMVSAKKNTPPGIISNFSKRMSKKVFKNRRVTFELVKATESEENFTVYGTPTATMEIIEEINEQEEVDISIPGSPPNCLLFKFMKRMRSAINIIPRTISTAWDWSNQRFGTSRTNDDHEIRSPLKKRPKYDTRVNTLVRRPITSYWVDMSVNSMFRKPLPNYVHRLNNFEENYP